MPEIVQGESGPCLQFIYQGSPYRAYPPDYTVIYRWVETSRMGQPRNYEVRVQRGGKLGERLQRVVRGILERGEIAAQQEG